MLGREILFYLWAQLPYKSFFVSSLQRKKGADAIQVRWTNRASYATVRIASIDAHPVTMDVVVAATPQGRWPRIRIE
jgi:hypothetical protein